MADFLAAINYVLVNEGGYSNDPNDPGGATNFGIEQKEWPEINIATITREQAVAWYQPNYWNKAPYAAIVSQEVATKLFDMHVNCGLGTAVRMAQEALGFKGSDVDGGLGPATLAAINAAEPDSFLAAVVDLLKAHYKTLEARNPKLLEFDRGWMARAVNLPPKGTDAVSATA